MVKQIIYCPVHARAFNVGHVHGWKKLWWSLWVDCMEWCLCIWCLIRACTFFRVIMNLCLFIRQCRRLCLSKTFILSILDYWWPLSIKLLAIWFKILEILWYKWTLLNCQLWACLTLLGTLSGVCKSLPRYMSKTVLTMQASCDLDKLTYPSQFQLSNILNCKCSSFLVLWLGTQVKSKLKAQ